MSTTSGTRVIRWPQDLPAAAPFDRRRTPEQVMMSLVGALQRDGEELEWVLDAAAQLRVWWQALGDQGQRLDPYPDLTGDGYVWSTMRMVAAVGMDPTGPGVWNRVRRAEANLRAWTLERLSLQEAAVVVESGAVRGPNTRKSMLGWEWIQGSVI